MLLVSVDGNWSVRSAASGAITAQPGPVDAEPTALFRDSPTWALDTTAMAYIKSCQGSSPGDNIDPGYLAYFDFNADGQVDVADLGQFASRYLTTLP